jgi:hypothetical protein
MMITSRKRESRFSVVAALTGLSMLHGCALESEELDDEIGSLTQAIHSGNVVTDWAAVAFDVVSKPVEASPGFRTPGHSSMLMAQVQLAVYDVMVAIRDDGDDGFEPFSYAEETSGHPNRNAAVATAAYRVLRTRTPGRAAFLDATYAAELSEIKDGPRKTAGIALGEDVAAHYLALRAGDNLDNTYVWVQPTPGPGVFEPTTPTPTQPVDYKMTFVPPYTFDIADTSSFFPPPPPALTSAVYTSDWSETRDLGRVDSTIRTEAEKQLALWSAEHPFRWAARNLTELAVARNLNPMRSARFFALVYTSIADSVQSGFSAKYHYNFWRPFHSIPRADTDGNPATTADPSWKPLLVVNHPEYPAGHGFFGGGAMVEAVRAFFHTDKVKWTVTTVGVAGLTETSRSYKSLDALAQDILDARVFAGLHYRFAVDAGRAQAIEIVDHILENHFGSCDD